MNKILVFFSFLIFISCQDKVICPSYQSTYILDDSTRNAYFSYVWQLDNLTQVQYLSQLATRDSTGIDSLGVGGQPKTDYYAYAGEYVVPWRNLKRTKYGIVKRGFYPLKKYRMRTAPMENVLAPEPISNELLASDFGVDSLQSDSLSSAIAMDSISRDSTEIAKIEAPTDKEVKFLYGYDPSDNFNVEQKYYNKYFAPLLIENRPKSEGLTSDSLTNNVASDSLSEKEPFFKGLFKKKNKNATDAPSLEEEIFESEPEEDREEQKKEEEKN